MKAGKRRRENAEDRMQNAESRRQKAEASMQYAGDWIRNAENRTICFEM